MTLALILKPTNDMIEGAPGKPLDEIDVESGVNTFVPLKTLFAVLLSILRLN